MIKKEKIPVYDICSLSADKHQPGFLIERFGNYLNRHSSQLHLPHRHSFYHLVFFSKGSGTHSIDFSQFQVNPFDIYFMIPGQVHSWQFEKKPDGFIINFPEDFFRSFLSDSHYLERFHFFSGVATESVCRLPVAIRTKITTLFETMLSVYLEEKLVTKIC